MDNKLEKSELTIVNEYGRFYVEYGDKFSMYCDSWDDFLDMMIGFKLLFDEIGFEPMVERIFSESGLSQACELTVSGSSC